MPRQLHRFVSFAFAVADLLIEVDEKGTICFVLGAASGLTHQRDEAWLGKPWLDLFHPDDRALVQATATSLTAGARCGTLPVRLAGNGSADAGRPALLNACRLPGNGNRLSCALSAASPADPDTPVARPRDPESGLLDQASFTTAAAGIGTAAREAGRDLGLMFLDLPELAGLAASRPTTCADLVHRIGALLRAGAIDGDSAGRLTATRFAVVHDTDASELGHRLQDVAAAGVQAGVRLSMTGHRMELDARDLGHDELMQAVRFTVNRFAGGSAMPGSVGAAFEQMVGDTLQRMSAFASAVDGEDFELAFQPIVDLATGELDHFEVLSRFSGEVSPFEKIRFAEEIGIIERFDIAVCTRALALLRSPPPGAARPLRLAVNLSGRSIANSLFVRLLLALLDQHRDLAGQLSLEITESVQLTDLAQADRVIQECRLRGFAVCLDDFGAGAASFPYLQSLIIDGVKIDGAYIRKIGQSPRDDALLRGLVRLCSDLGVDTTAEMIETATQAEFLRSIGVRHGQGWLFGKATPTPTWPAAKTSAPVAGRTRARRQGVTEGWG
ncbi:hypothetical protein N826_04700 [Skermanella aerolata KACC 11604]|uniref:sensor domain-containing phosphodiesterase n=4 Tax=Skermanella aerolata TaxID=393310 RepID=UPI0005DEA63E|nr:EAL domain-containing protein [Skermanella aerolata]KJB90204.1 hypothetical protein N826_04700 [Skermanella aerolata KACC 11604]